MVDKIVFNKTYNDKLDLEPTEKFERKINSKHEKIMDIITKHKMSKPSKLTQIIMLY